MTISTTLMERVARLQEQAPTITHFLGLAQGSIRRDMAYRHVPDFLLREGRAYTPRKLHRRYAEFPAKACYHNAQILVLRSKDALRYVEGVAYPEGGIPVHHAWAVDEYDEVVDVTWVWGRQGPVRQARGEMVGVEIPWTLVAATLVERERSGPLLDAFPYGWPLLRVPWLQTLEEWT